MCTIENEKLSERYRNFVKNEDVVFCDVVVGITEKELCTSTSMQHETQLSIKTCVFGKEKETDGVVDFRFAAALLANLDAVRRRQQSK